MRKRANRTSRTIRRKRRQDEKGPATSVARGAAAGVLNRQASSQIYHLLGEKRENRSASTKVDVPVGPEVQGRGETAQHSGFAQILSLEGRTDATFDGGSFSTQGVRQTRATGCSTCTDDQCVHVTGAIVATYHVTTTVTLPRVSDFPDLTPCQRSRVQSAIGNVLAPHEQQHVAAFRAYNGTTRTPFNLTLCRSDFDSTIDSMFQTASGTRQSAAQAASDALDPFHFDVDLDCEEPRRRSSTPPAAPDAGEGENDL